MWLSVGSSSSLIEGMGYVGMFGVPVQFTSLGSGELARTFLDAFLPGPKPRWLGCGFRTEAAEAPRDRVTRSRLPRRKPSAQKRALSFGNPMRRFTALTGGVGVSARPPGAGPR